MACQAGRRLISDPSLQDEIIRSYLKNVDQGSGKGAERIRSGAYTLVCEHFDPIRNTAMGP